MSSNASGRREVVQLTPNGRKLIKEWGGVNEAAKALGLVNMRITQSCRGQRKTYGGFSWQYADDYRRLSDKQKNNEKTQ